jgi:hypothetical protein
MNSKEIIYVKAKDPGSRVVHLGAWPFSVGDVDSLGISFVSTKRTPGKVSRVSPAIYPLNPKQTLAHLMFLFAL